MKNTRMKWRLGSGPQSFKRLERFQHLSTQELSGILWKGQLWCIPRRLPVVFEGGCRRTFQTECNMDTKARSKTCVHSNECMIACWNGTSSFAKCLKAVSENPISKSQGCLSTPMSSHRWIHLLPQLAPHIFIVCQLFTKKYEAKPKAAKVQ